jgi:hypothetical protein
MQTFLKSSSGEPISSTSVVCIDVADQHLINGLHMQNFKVETRYIPMGSTVPTTRTDYFMASNAAEAEQRARSIYSRSNQVLTVTVR